MWQESELRWLEEHKGQIDECLSRDTAKERYIALNRLFLLSWCPSVDFFLKLRIALANLLESQVQVTLYYLPEGNCRIKIVVEEVGISISVKKPEKEVSKYLSDPRKFFLECPSEEIHLYLPPRFYKLFLKLVERAEVFFSFRP